MSEALAVAASVFVLISAAEWLHSRRVRVVAALAFGPSRRPLLWAMLAPFLRIAAFTAAAWGLTLLLTLPPRVHKMDQLPESQLRDLILVLDVSPSMRLQDAGPEAKLTRRKRAAEILKSFFERTPMEIYRTSVVAFYNGAKPVVVRTTDAEVVRNILEDLPMEYAFEAGPTDLFAGLEEAVKIAQPWRPRSTTLVIVSDGDVIAPTGMPKLPASIAHVLVVGVGDTKTGRFIDGHLSRQDASSLRQMAQRLGGKYHDGNTKHLSTELVQSVGVPSREAARARWGRREYALLAVVAGSGVLALLPLALYLFGTTWRPGVRAAEVRGQWSEVRDQISEIRSQKSVLADL